LSSANDILCNSTEMKNTLNTENTYKVPACLSWFFPYKIKDLPISSRSSAAYYLLQNKLSLTIINWLFQGMKGMDASDLTGKIIFEIFFFSVFFVFLNNPGIYGVLIALVFSHTLNWLFNAHFWVFGRYLGITHTPPDLFFPYIRRVVNRVNRDSSVPMVIIIGSISRNQRFKTTSDVDIMFIRGAGISNAIMAVFVTMRERAIAFFSKFPLHLEFYDTMESMNQHRADEIPVLLKDVGGLAEDWYDKAGRETARLDDYAESG